MARHVVSRPGGAGRALARIHETQHGRARRVVAGPRGTRLPEAGQRTSGLDPAILGWARPNMSRPSWAGLPAAPTGQGSTCLGAARLVSSGPGSSRLGTAPLSESWPVMAWPDRGRTRPVTARPGMARPDAAGLVWARHGKAPLAGRVIAGRDTTSQATARRCWTWLDQSRLAKTRPGPAPHDTASQDSTRLVLASPGQAGHGSPCLTPARRDVTGLVTAGLALGLARLPAASPDPARPGGAERGSTSRGTARLHESDEAGGSTPEQAPASDERRV